MAQDVHTLKQKSVKWGASLAERDESDKLVWQGLAASAGLKHDKQAVYVPKERQETKCYTAHTTDSFCWYKTQRATFFQSSDGDDDMLKKKQQSKNREDAVVSSNQLAVEKYELNKNTSV